MSCEPASRRLQCMADYSGDAIDQAAAWQAATIAQQQSEGINLSKAPQTGSGEAWPPYYNESHGFYAGLFSMQSLASTPCPRACTYRPHGNGQNVSLPSRSFCCIIHGSV